MSANAFRNLGANRPVAGKVRKTYITMGEHNSGARGARNHMVTTTITDTSTFVCSLTRVKTKGTALTRVTSNNQAA